MACIQTWLLFVMGGGRAFQSFWFSSWVAYTRHAGLDSARSIHSASERERKRGIERRGRGGRTGSRAQELRLRRETPDLAPPLPLPGVVLALRSKMVSICDPPLFCSYRSPDLLPVFSEIFWYLNRFVRESLPSMFPPRFRFVG